MAFDFKNAYNKVFAEPGTKLNRSVNKIIGKDVFKDIKTMDEPREFQPFDTFEPYNVPEPEQWKPITGESKNFPFQDNLVTVSANLDTCMQYVTVFKECAKYYADRFKFRYNQCVTDYDSLLYYYQSIYEEGLAPMVKRAYSLLLPFNVFNVSVDVFYTYHVNTYNKATVSYKTMLNIIENRNQQAENLGNTVGNSMHMQGGGFGLKGAMKGAAKAEAFNMGLGLIGKYVSNQTKMSAQEKAELFSKFNKDIFFEEVYYDYLNTFFTLIQTLSENGVISEISTRINDEYRTTIDNLNNPMFPSDKVAPLLASLITKYPFTVDNYNVAKSRFGETDEIKAIMEYFII